MVPRRSIGAGLFAATLAAAGALSPSAPVPGGDSTGAPSRIVLVTIDTLRADHLHAYGYPRQTSPFLDRLAATGVRFEHAFVPMSTTVPSHASLFTSRHPLQLGVLKNGDRLSHGATTLAEALRGEGFLTAAFVGPPRHFGPANLDQGFEHFDELDNARPYRQADRTVEAALSWLDHRTPDERFFLWLNLFDPHWPPIAPANRLKEVRRDGAESRAALVDLLLGKRRLDPDFFDAPEAARWLTWVSRTARDRPTPRGVEAMLDVMDGYDASIRFVDAELERLYRQLDDKGLREGTLWIVTSDHGEGLGSHRWLAHGKHIYNEQLRVPLIFWSASGLRRGAVVSHLVETLDVVPTVFDLLGYPLPPDGPLAEAFPSGFEGVSLRPPLTAPSSGDPDRHAFAQRRTFDAIPAVGARSRYESGETFALQDRRHKLLYRTDGPEELYALADDPFELENLAGTGTEAEQRLRRALREKLRELQDQAAPRGEGVDAETLERLKALGYVE